MRISYLFSAVLLMFLTGSAAAVQQQQAKNTGRAPQFENRYVTVWKTRILPNQPLALHRHQYGRTLVVFKGGTLDVVNAAGATVRRFKLETGKAYWLGADPPKVLHRDVNRGKEPIEVMVIEMKRHGRPSHRR